MKRFVSVCLILCLALVLFSGCVTAMLKERPSKSSSSAQEESSQISNSSTGSVEGNRIEPEGGFAGGRAGDVMATAFFDFSLLSAEKRTEYQGYAPAQGKVLVDLVIKVYNTFGKTLPMFATDFQIQWGTGEEDYGYPVEAVTEGQAVPKSYQLHPFETVEYHYVYEVPEDTEEYSVSFLEVYEDETQGDVFFIYFELP